MGETKTFALGAVLSITTGRLVCDIGEVYEILNWMTEDNLFTHQLPRAMRECAPWLARWFPELPGKVSDFASPKAVHGWVADQVAKHGATREVPHIPRDDHTVRDPLEELTDMVGPERIIAVEGRSRGED